MHTDPLFPLGSDFDTLLAIYTGSTVDDLTLVAENDNDGALMTSKVTFNASESMVYRIAVDGRDGAFGSVVLNLDATPAIEPPTPPATLRTRMGPRGPNKLRLLVGFPDSSTNEDYFLVEVSKKKQKGGWSSWRSKVQVPAGNGGVMETGVNLQRNNRYKVRVSAVNSNGVSSSRVNRIRTR
jgi:hypothetical protein